MLLDFSGGGGVSVGLSLQCVYIYICIVSVCQTIFSSTLDDLILTFNSMDLDVLQCFHRNTKKDNQFVLWHIARCCSGYKHSQLIKFYLCKMEFVLRNGQDKCACKRIFSIDIFSL